jgi:hypothetical protein
MGGGITIRHRTTGDLLAPLAYPFADDPRTCPRHQGTLDLVSRRDLLRAEEVLSSERRARRAQSGHPASL